MFLKPTGGTNLTNFNTELKVVYIVSIQPKDIYVN